MNEAEEVYGDNAINPTLQRQLRSVALRSGLPGTVGQTLENSDQDSRGGLWSGAGLSGAFADRSAVG